MPNEKYITATQLAALWQEVGPVRRGVQFECNSPLLREIFDHAPLGYAAILEVVETTCGYRVSWA